ncbi:MAG: ATP-dependent DNA helicase [Promethearchaeota archaeon]|nr:MAG: ATP-dependent DNA helicase [Candidatus Lokiarchaeota archaeon]
MEYSSFFPYSEFRVSQETIIKQIEEGTRNSNNILLVAPNGTGKTIIALSSLLPVAFEKDLKIIYMCRTHSQNTRVIKELHKISNLFSKRKSSLKVNGLSIRGRNEMCLNETLLSLKTDPRGAMSVCSDLRKNRNCKYFINLLQKRENVDSPILISPEIFSHPVDADVLIEFCKQKNLCPYFLSKFLLKDMRVIICNYQWIFHPFIRKTFLKFIEADLSKCILVLDECHNIIDIATEVNSDRISPYSLKLCLKDLEIYDSPGKMQAFVNFLMRHLTDIKKNLRQNEKEINPISFLKLILERMGFDDLNSFENFIKDLYKFSNAIHEEKIANGIFARDYVGSLAEFWLQWLRTYSLDKYFFCYSVKKSKKEGRKFISMEIVALDPREIVIPVLNSCHSCLHLSGTVNPYVYNNLMGLNQTGKRYQALLANSPFKRKNIKALITEGVDTRRANRNPRMFQKINEKISEVLRCTPENVGIFCASYKILKGLVSNNLQEIVEKFNKKLFIESSDHSASENAYMVDDFKSMAQNQNGGGVLLGVCGGRNSEGEDYPGGFMNSIIVAGFPYHLPTPRVQAKIDYYDKVFNNQGWNFGYLYPAIQRANQAAGRPIRKMEDKGAIIFMDSRFKQKHQWISEWIRSELEIVPDKHNSLVQTLCPFWQSRSV